MAKILFIGGREKGLVCFNSLITLGADIVWAYILKEDEHEKEKFSWDIKDFCKKKKIGYKLAKTVKGEKKRIRGLKPDLIVVCGWRTIIPEAILKIPKSGCIAFHESLLPKYRGFAPINWAVINGEKYSGVTMFYLDSGIDSGNIIDQEKIAIGPNETAFEIYQKTIDISLSLLNKHYQAIISGKVEGVRQNESEATYLCARTPEDGRINWLDSAVNIHNLVRGLSHPFPGAFCFYKDKKIIIQKSKIPKQIKWDGSIPGRIVYIKPNIGVEILTGDGSILITAVEVDKKMYNPADYFKSIKDRLV